MVITSRTLRIALLEILCTKDFELAEIKDNQVWLKAMYFSVDS